MKVYRVALADDVTAGPYQAQGFWQDPLVVEMCIAHDNLDHPAPKMDPELGYIIDNEYCALDSLEALMTWFEGFLPGLGRLGFAIHVFETNTARVGKNGQALFYMQLAERLGTIPLTV